MIIYLCNTYKTFKKPFLSTKRMKMKASDSCLVVERMIQQGEISPSELESLLHSLTEQQLITTAGHKSLLELATKINSDRLLPP